MNTKWIFSFALIGTMLGCNAQQTQMRSVSSFDKIQLSGALTVVYTESDTVNVSVKARSADLDKVETKVEDGVLMISSKGNIDDDAIVYVNNNKLSNLLVSGSSEFRTINAVHTDKLDLNASGSSNVQLRYSGKVVNCIQSGASTINLKGEADTLLANVSGASTFKSYGLTSKHVKIAAAGASTAKVFASETMKASATGASDIKIKGEPRELSAEAGTAASISRSKDVSTTELTEEPDTTTYNLKNRKVLVIKTKEDTEDKEDETPSWKHWKGFSMGVNGYYNDNGGINMKNPNSYMELNYARSFNFQFNLIERQFDLIQNYMKVVTGFGFDYHLYEFANRTTLNADSTYTWGTIAPQDGTKYLKNKLRATYIQVPLLLEFNTSNDAEKTWHIGVGVVGQYLISSRTKQVIEDNRDVDTKWRKDSYNLSPFGAKAHVNVGYRGWTLFGEYSLTPLFNASKGPELYPFTAGIRLVPFS